MEDSLLQMSEQVENMSRSQGNLGNSGETESRMLQLCRTQQSRDLLYLECLRKLRSVFTEKLRGQKRNIKADLQMEERTGEGLSLAPRFMFLLYPKLWNLLPHPHSLGTSQRQAQGLIKPYRQQKAREARENQHRADTRDQRTGVWEPFVGGHQAFPEAGSLVPGLLLGLEPWNVHHTADNFASQR